MTAPAWRAVQQRLAAREAVHPLYGSVRYAVAQRQIARQAAAGEPAAAGLRAVPAERADWGARAPQREPIRAAAAA